MRDPDKLQDDIDTLLTFMNNDLEAQGLLIPHAVFNFSGDGPDGKALMEKTGWLAEELQRLLKVCATRSLVKELHGSFRYGTFEVALTEEGQSRAISVMHGKERSYELGSGMQIASLTIHGQAQVGNGNIQNINNVFAQLQEQIELADAPTEQKEEAKSLLSKFLEHPLVCSVIGGVVGGVTGNMK